MRNLLSPLLAKDPWLRFFTYSLFVFSTVSITGVELSVIGLYITAIFSRSSFTTRSSVPWWIVAPFAMWVGVATLSSLVNPEWLSNLQTLRHQYRIFLPFVLLVSLNKVKLERLLLVYLSLVCVIGVYAWIQSYYPIDLLRMEKIHPLDGVIISRTGKVTFRAQGFFVGPGFLASHMMMIGLLFGSLALNKKVRRRGYFAVGTALSAVGLIASYGRSAWLGTMIGMLILGFRLPHRRAVLLASVGGTVILTCFILIVSGWVNDNMRKYTESAIVDRLATATTENSEIRLRTTMWKAGIEAIHERPWLGYGFDNRQAAVAYLPPKSPSVPWDVPLGESGVNLHNIYLQVANDFGFAGLVAYLSIWLAIFAWNGIWMSRAGGLFPLETAILSGTSAGLMGSMVDGLFHDTFFSGNSNATILIFMGLSLNVGSRIRSGLVPKILNPRNVFLELTV